ncbi:MAG: hypothetical protein M1821_001338 [Bathelium mastoideum]|nr:MAG: hypothetical protein M1821_001338 [Bathelium mastoideum]KAI9689863.1 MAG: hypothetical protein M1822_009745 [Bathelium mastoideum]
MSTREVEKQVATSSTAEIDALESQLQDQGKPHAGLYTTASASTIPPAVKRDRLARWNAKIEGLAGLEARGISRVMPEEKQAVDHRGYVQMVALWFGMNLCVINLVVGLLGPLVYNLGWVDSVCITIFANALSSCAPAYMATFGPSSGLRSMVLARFFMGYWPAKVVCLLNIIMQTGWGFICAIIAGQMLSAINGGNMSIAVGCVIGALGIGLLVTFGIAILHTYERYAWIPQLIALFTLIGSSGRNWNTSLASLGDPSTITANRCCFFTIEFSILVGYAAISSDLYVYYPVRTSRRLTFLTTWVGVWTSTMFVNLIGVGIATGVSTNSAWTEAYAVSSGALLNACFEGLGGFGGFCIVILALGAIQNNAPATYVAALSIQSLGRYTRKVPRWVCSLFLTVVELVCSVAGRDSLFNIFEDFLPIMTYWVCSWLAIVVEEHLLFRCLQGLAFDWSAWEDPKRLPVGMAAMAAWLVGWAGAIIGMAQVWYTGPIALRIGGTGGDIGAWLSIAFAGVVYPPLRYLEVRRFGR